jgi:hypothetical protein
MSLASWSTVFSIKEGKSRKVASPLVKRVPEKFPYFKRLS